MSDRKGFTLIELLIVVVIIGILAAIAIPKFSATREKAYVSSMQADLRNLATLQELYYAEFYEYAAAEDAAGLDWLLSSRVAVDAFSGDDVAWSATVSHTGTGTTCESSGGDGGTGTVECTTP